MENNLLDVIENSINEYNQANREGDKLSIQDKMDTVLLIHMIHTHVYNFINKEFSDYMIKTPLSEHALVDIWDRVLSK